MWPVFFKHLLFLCNVFSHFFSHNFNSKNINSKLTDKVSCNDSYCQQIQEKASEIWTPCLWYNNIFGNNVSIENYKVYPLRIKKLPNAESNSRNYLQYSAVFLLRWNSNASNGQHFPMHIWLIHTEARLNSPCSNPGLFLAVTNACAKQWSNCHASTRPTSNTGNSLPSACSKGWHTLLRRNDLEPGPGSEHIPQHLVACTCYTLGPVSITVYRGWKTVCRACIQVHLPNIMTVGHREDRVCPF